MVKKVLLRIEFPRTARAVITFAARARPVKTFFAFAAAAAYFGRPWSSEEDDKKISDVQRRRLSNRGWYDDKTTSKDSPGENSKKGEHYVNWVKAGDYQGKTTPWGIIEPPKADNLITFFSQFASMLVTSFTSLCSYTFVKGFCDFGMYNYDKFENAFYENKHRPLLTVGNHQSTVDDPLIISMIAPLRELSYDTRRLRWGLCAEEICFKNEFLSSYFGAGKILPIKRNLRHLTKHSAVLKTASKSDTVTKRQEGINQSRFHAFTNKLRPGNWVHIFPEGRVCQKSLNVPNSNWNRSYLRWGVGKMIVQSVRKGHYPIVLPFYHDGLNEVIPCDENDNVISSVPRIGKRVLINFGDPVVYEDLIESFLNRGKNKFSENPWDNLGDPNPPPTQEELKLYSDITKRIMEKLIELEKQTKQL